MDLWIKLKPENWQYWVSDEQAINKLTHLISLLIVIIMGSQWKTNKEIIKKFEVT